MSVLKAEYDCMNDLILALETVRDGKDRPMHHEWATGVREGFGKKEAGHFKACSDALGGTWMELDSLFRPGSYEYGTDGFGQEPIPFMRDSVNRNPGALGLREGQVDSMVDFLEWFWESTVKPVVASRKADILDRLSLLNSAISAGDGMKALCDVSERVSVANGTIAIQKKMDLDIDGSGLSRLRICPSLFVFPFLVIQHDTDGGSFMVTDELPFSSSSSWIADSDTVSSIAFALSDRSRLRILLLLSRNELTQNELCTRLAFAKSTVSRHLDILERAGLIVETEGSCRGKSYRPVRTAAESFSASLGRWMGYGYASSSDDQRAGSESTT